jgi:phosphatidate cytidylyltransferase
MLRQRLVTAAILLALLLSALYLLPNLAWSLLTIVPIALGAWEWARLSRFGRTRAQAFVGVVTVSALLLVWLQWRGPETAMVVAAWLYLAALFFWAIVATAWLYFKWRMPAQGWMACIGWIVLVPAWLAIASLQHAANLLLMLLAAVWIADSAAYFAGRRFGRRKLAPRISPGKTWEGVYGAGVAVLAYAVIAGFVLMPGAGLPDRVALMIFFGLLTAFSIIGDLFESWIKREAGAKDSGTLLPGHGGVLDRIDSLTAAMPFAALYFLHAA